MGTFCSFNPITERDLVYNIQYVKTLETTDSVHYKPYWL